jgi:hypothetical protein
MTTRTITRLGAASGAAYVVLAILGSDVLGAGDTPSSSAPPAAFAHWLVANHPSGAGWIAPFLELLALLCFVVFAAALYDTLRRAERERTWLPAAALGAALVSAAIKVSSAPAMLAAFELAPRGIDPQLAAALVNIDNYAFLLTWAIDALMIGAVAAVALRTAVLPRWQAITGAVLAPLMLASVAAGENGPPVFLLALLWFVAVSVALARTDVREYVRSPVVAGAG